MVSSVVSASDSVTSVVAAATVEVDEERLLSEEESLLEEVESVVEQPARAMPAARNRLDPRRSVRRRGRLGVSVCFVMG